MASATDTELLYWKEQKSSSDEKYRAYAAGYAV